MLTLRNVLRLDSAACALMGVLLVAGSNPIADLMALPAPLLFYAGILLLPIAGYMAVVSLLRPVPPLAVRVVILGNGSWVAASLLILAGGWAAPNVLGIAFVLGQAAIVAVLMILERNALRAVAQPMPTV